MNAQKSLANGAAVLPGLFERLLGADGRLHGGWAWAGASKTGGPEVVLRPFRHDLEDSQELRRICKDAGAVTLREAEFPWLYGLRTCPASTGQGLATCMVQALATAAAAAAAARPALVGDRVLSATIFRNVASMKIFGRLGYRYVQTVHMWPWWGTLGALHSRLLAPAAAAPAAAAEAADGIGIDSSSNSQRSPEQPLHERALAGQQSDLAESAPHGRDGEARGAPPSVSPRLEGADGTGSGPADGMKGEHDRGVETELPTSGDAGTKMKNGVVKAESMLAAAGAGWMRDHEAASRLRARWRPCHGVDELEALVNSARGEVLGADVEDPDWRSVLSEAWLPAYFVAWPVRGKDVAEALAGGNVWVLDGDAEEESLLDGEEEDAGRGDGESEGEGEFRGEGGVGQGRGRGQGKSKSEGEDVADLGPDLVSKHARKSTRPVGVLAFIQGPVLEGDMFPVVSVVASSLDVAISALVLADERVHRFLAVVDVRDYERATELYETPGGKEWLVKRSERFLEWSGDSVFSFFVMGTAIGAAPLAGGRL
eukprot:jgi/Mesen1/1010/ME000121S00090